MKMSRILLFVAVMFLGACASDTAIASEETETSSMDRIVEWVRIHNSGSVGNDRFSFGAVALSANTTEPMSGTQVELRVYTDLEEITELGLTVSNDPCRETFVFGLLRALPNGSFEFDNGAQPTVGPPTEFSLALPRCEVPRPEIFLTDSLGKPFTIDTSDGEIAFVSSQSNNELSFRVGT